jgi:hypothetical protein
MKAILVNYNFTPTWLLESDHDWHIFDRSDSKEWLKDFPQERITYTENLGQVDYDKLTYLVNNYDTLPNVFLWGKTNLFKYITPEEYAKIKDNQMFTPLLTKNHTTYSDILGAVCYYSQDIYWERNNSWYANQFASRTFETFPEFATHFGLPNPPFLPFAPGGNYILTKEVVHRYSRDMYEEMANMLPYCREPVEAQMCERSYYLLWK